MEGNESLYQFFEELNVPYLVTILFVSNLFVAFAIIFLERKNPSATLAWIMILFLLPAVGIFFYFTFSQNISRQRIFKLSTDEKDLISNALNEQQSEIKQGKFNFVNAEAEKWEDMILLHQTYSKAFFTQDNVMSIFTDGNNMFDSLIEDIDNAKDTINIMFFIIKNDCAGKRLLTALAQKAEEGVEVRLLIDAMGGRQIFEKDLKRFREVGGKAAFFFKPTFKLINLKLNYRNHRKLVIIDGEKAYIGGFNIGKEYLGLKKKFGNWRDTHLKLAGSCVQDINARFILDWRVASKEDLTVSQAYYSPIGETGNTGIQIVSSGPDSQKEEVKRGYMKMITSATKNVYIQTPYFVPDGSILESLKMAALSGVDVRIMIPCMPDHMFVYWATTSYVGELLHSGVRVFVYKNGFLHAKTMVVDGEVATVGSANFDMRSFKLNFEANAFIYDAGEAFKLEAIFESDISQCMELTEEIYAERSVKIKFKESISRLLSDLL